MVINRTLKLGQRKEGSSPFLEICNLGDIKAMANFVGIVCRDLISARW